MAEIINTIGTGQQYITITVAELTYKAVSGDINSTPKKVKK